MAQAQPQNLMAKKVIAFALMLLATPAAAADIGTCYSRTYPKDHLAAHPDQKVAMISFGRSDVEGAMVYSVRVKLKGQTEIYQGSAYCEPSLKGFACGMEGDAGAILVLPRSTGDILISVHPDGLSFEGDSDFLTLSGRSGDDREFLLKPATPESCG